MTELQSLPDLVVRLGGRRLTQIETASIGELQVRSALAQPAQCVVSWHFTDPRPGRRIDPAPGDPLRVEMAGHPTALFVGEVTVVEYSYSSGRLQELRVRAYDALHRLRKRQYTRMHDVADLGELAAALCEGTGLQIVGGQGSVGAVYQCARSDLDLLVDISSKHGLYPVVQDRILRLVSLTGEGRPLELEFGSNLHSAEIEVSQEPSFRSSEAVGWLAENATVSVGRAEGTGPGAAVQADPAPQSVGGGGPVLRHNNFFTDDVAATAAARADLDVRAAGEVAGVFLADGDPDLQAGARVLVTGVAATLEGTFAVCEAVHTLDRGGYETRVSTLPPAPPRPSGPDQFTLGVVSDTVDPEGRGRVRVDLPALPDLVTGWAPVMMLGAGPQKGLVVLPENGDMVLVLLVTSDPGNAVVLGGLYGSERPPDADLPGARGGRFTAQTADGQQLVLDSEKRSIHLTNGRGSIIELGLDSLRIHSVTDLDLEAPGRRIRIRAAAVDFEESQ
jgi:phage baseplate assembly protein gpV